MDDADRDGAANAEGMSHGDHERADPRGRRVHRCRPANLRARDAEERQVHRLVSSDEPTVEPTTVRESERQLMAARHLRSRHDVTRGPERAGPERAACITN